MTLVKGQIESLERLKWELKQKGIQRFNSVKDIHTFLNNYELERQAILNETEKDVNIKIERLRAQKINFIELYNADKTREINKLNNLIDELNNKCKSLETDNGKNVFVKALDFVRIIILNNRKTRLVRDFDRIINNKTIDSAQKIQETNDQLIQYTENKERLINQLYASKIKELQYTKEVVDDLYPIITGAIGENSVVNELKKLSDRNILINNFSLDFDRPIYNRNEDDKIFSIQIDHLLITNAGVFILETKNWSKTSVENLNLRSPIQQIRRSSFAMYILLNGDSSLRLTKHHWGEKKIPIRNVVVMIHNKPKEKFKYVEVKTLKELNRYLSYFDPILDDSEVRGIATYLSDLRH